MVANLREALGDWSWLKDMSDLEVTNTTCLGDVILRDASGSEFILNVNAAELRPFDEKEKELLSGQSEFISRMERHGLSLGPDQCYGMKPYDVFKSYDPEHMYVARLAEYVSYMGYFHCQIKDVPDGAAARLEVMKLPTQ
jgi:hypothetical protein